MIIIILIIMLIIIEHYSKALLPQLPGAPCAYSGEGGGGGYYKYIKLSPIYYYVKKNPYKSDIHYYHIHQSIQTSMCYNIKVRARARTHTYTHTHRNHTHTHTHILHTHTHTHTHTTHTLHTHTHTLTHTHTHCSQSCSTNPDLSFTLFSNIVHQLVLFATDTGSTAATGDGRHHQHHDTRHRFTRQTLRLGGGPSRHCC